MFYRGRLDQSAQLLAIASDPGPTERIAYRTLVGNAGQRVQGFLTKIGLTRSDVLVNAFAYALLPSRAQQATPMLAEPAHLEWRNQLLDAVTGPDLQAVVAFGAQAQRSVDLWPNPPGCRCSRSRTPPAATPAPWSATRRGQRAARPRHPRPRRRHHGT